MLSLHVKYFSPDDEWPIDLLRYVVVISYLEQRQVNSADGVDMLKNAAGKETDFELLLGHIEKKELSAAIKNIDENLRGDTCTWLVFNIC